MKKAFTLIELLVVIGIIAILVGVLAVAFGKGTDSARSAKCLANLKSLSSAVNSYVMVTGRYPNAGSVESYGLSLNQGGKSKRSFYELPGWISWNSGRAYENNPTGHTSSRSWFISAYDQNVDAREYCLTNGAIWKYVSGNRDVFVCPMHQRAMATNQKPGWSYVMNGWFRYDTTSGSGSKPEGYYRLKEHVTRLDRRLLFGELQWAKGATGGSDPTISTGAGTECDCTLQYDDGKSGHSEKIGFNHKEGKDYVAHVVFADGHVEKLLQPRQKLSESDIKELTRWLCEAKDVSFNGKKYEELK